MAITKNTKDPVPAPVVPIDLDEDNMYHWNVKFEIEVDKDAIEFKDGEVPPEESVIFMEDNMIVRAGADALVAIHKCKNYVLNQDNSEEYGLPAKSFRLVGVKLASVATI